jgi:hypothetical protein
MKEYFDVFSVQKEVNTVFTHKEPPRLRVVPKKNLILHFLYYNIRTEGAMIPAREIIAADTSFVER